jgi:hypothetical protein
VWEEIDSVTQEMANNRHRGGCSIKWPQSLKTIYGDVGVKKPFAYFHLLAPLDFIRTTVIPATAAVYESEHRGNAPSFGIFLRFLGVLMHMTLEPRRGSKNDHWSTEKATKNEINFSLF